MDWMHWAALGAGWLFGVVSSLTKLRWSQEYTKAKDEVIRAKEAQIEFLQKQVRMLQEWSPNKIRDYFIAVRTSLEEYIDFLKEALATANAELRRREQALVKLRATDEKKAQEQAEALEREQAAISAASRELETKIKQVQRGAINSEAELKRWVSEVDDTLAQAFRDLSQLASHLSPEASNELDQRWRARQRARAWRQG